MKKFLLLVLLIFAGCSSRVEVDASAFSGNNPLIKMSKTQCYGRCPVYDLEINGNGEVYLDGKENIDKLGKYILRIDKEEVIDLLNEFNNAGFWSMNNEYDGRVTDLPSTYISVEYAGETKKVKARFNIPKELTHLEDILSAYTERFGWIKLEEQNQ